MPKNRDKFFKLVKAGEKYDKAVFLCYPKACLKQIVKNLLVKCKLVKTANKSLEYVLQIKKEGQNLMFRGVSK